tara:strand:+ start:1171 stop:1449 length:279 start_codon:yes stop_codon:yes gene_type:complete
MIPFHIDEVRAINKYVTTYSRERLESCESWNRDLKIQVELLNEQSVKYKNNLKQLTKDLNREHNKRVAARRQRVVWGICGVLGGFLIYDLIK